MDQMRYTIQTTFIYFAAAICFRSLVSLSLGNAFAQTDFDGDGISDFVGVKRPENQSMQWFVTSSAAGFSNSISALSFGLGDALPIPGNWLSSDFSSLAVWEKDPSSQAVLWKVLSGVDVLSLAFGSIGDRVVSGADFDGNGIQDLAVILSDGRVMVRSDLLAHTADASLPTTDYEISFLQRTTSRGVPLILRRNGGYDELGFLERRSTGNVPRYTLISRDIFGNVFEKNFGVVGRVVSTAYAIQNSAGSDSLLLVSNQGRKKKIFTLTNLDGAILYRTTAKTTKPLVIGDFLSTPGEEFAYFKKKKVRVVNPHSNVKASYPVDNFDPVDHLSVRKLETGVSTGTGGSSDSKSDDGPGLRSVCRSTKRFFPTALWKPRAEVNDFRGEKPVVLLRGGSKNGRSSIDIYAANGKKICNFTFKRPSEPGVNGDADHYYSGWIGGCGKDGNEIASLARKAAGKRKVYVQWKNGSCLGPVEPTAREGSL